MKRVRLWPIGKGYADQEWPLELGDDAVRVLDPAGTVLAAFPRREAPARLRLPSFWDSVKSFEVRLDDGRAVACDLPPKGLALVRDYLAGVALAADPEAASNTRTFGLLMVLAGGALAVVGTLVSVQSYEAAAARPEGGSFRITWGLVLFGVILAGKGFATLSRAARMREAAARRPRPNADGNPG